jgi:hypothetical protein
MSSSFLPRQPDFVPADNGLIFEARQPVPTVVVKRRRLTGFAPSTEAAQKASASEAPSQRDPKVFRLEATPVAAPATATGPESAPPLRRKRDPLRAPVLLRHEVMAPPSAEPGPAPAGADYRSVCEAIERVRRELDRVGHARRIRLSLP